VEILVGLYLLRSVFWTDDDYAAVFVTFIGMAGLLVLLAGTFGLVLAARNRLRT
jgi:hypothetical protein